MSYKILIYIDKNGNGHGIPWNDREDIRYFKRVTNDSIIIMSRSIFQSIGGLFPHRTNIVITKYTIPGVRTFGDINDAINEFEGEKIFFIGDSYIYKKIFRLRPLEIIVKYLDETHGDIHFPIDKLLEADDSLVVGDRNIYYFLT